MIFAAASLLGAVALFMLEPMLGKLLTPRFGGGAQIWAICLVFFQSMLFAGYAYADALQRLRSMRVQRVAHGCLWALALWSMAYGWGSLVQIPHGPADSPIAGLLTILFRTSALPFIALSSTSPLTQAWSARGGSASPFRLYAWSNLGSFAGLFSYPFLIEPSSGVGLQAWIALGLATLTAVFVLAAAARTPQAPPSLSAAEAFDGKGSARETVIWLAASFAGSALLMAVTTKLTSAIAAVPLLWIAPLAAYLFTFVLIFDARRDFSAGAWPVAWTALFALCALAALRIPMENGVYRWRHIGSELGMVFTGCMACHGWLYRHRPVAAHRITAFYLWIAGGGALGGLTMALAAPMAFDRLYEFGGSVLFLALLMVARMWGTRGMLRLAGVGAALAAACIGAASIRQESRIPGVISRNFYGVVQIERHGSLLSMSNLKTLHGMVDLRDPRLPLAYYGTESGAGRVFRLQMARRSNLSVGVLGLGIGAVADYCRPGDDYTFYEINPLVAALMRDPASCITTLTGAPGHVAIVEGDGRLALRQEALAGTARTYDILMVDAFSGDAVPWHLLTQEAFNLYLGRLAPGGILLIHVSNPLPVDRIVLDQARAEGLYGAYLLDEGSQNGDLRLKYNKYIALSREGEVLSDPLITDRMIMSFGPKTYRGETPWSPGAKFILSDRPWTDGRNSLSDLVFKEPAFGVIEDWLSRQPRMKAGSR